MSGGRGGVLAAVRILDAIKTVLKFYLYFSKLIFLLGRGTVTRFALIFPGFGCTRLLCLLLYGSSAKKKEVNELQPTYVGWPKDAGLGSGSLTG